MANETTFESVYDTLRDIMMPYAEQLVVVSDENGRVYVETKHIMKNKKPLNFGMVEIKKSYVSYHLMPLYMFPELLDGVSSELKRKMQGKQCFNFKSADDELFTELEGLTKKGFEAYEKAGYISSSSD